MKKPVCLIMVVLLTIICFGCNGQQVDSASAINATSSEKSAEVATEKVENSNTPSSEKIIFANLVPDMSDEYHVYVDKTLRSCFEGTNVEILTSDASQDTQLQLQQLESYIAMGVDYIHLNTLDFEAMRPAILDARAQNITVIVDGDPLDPEMYDIRCNTDQYALGDSLAKAAAKWVDEHFPDAPDGSIETIVFDLSAMASMEVYGRIEGLMNVDKYSSKIKVVDKPDPGLDLTAPKFQELIEASLIEHPDTKIILTFGSMVATAINESLLMMPTLDKDNMWVGTTDWNALLDAMLQETVDGNGVFRCAIGFENPGEIIADAVLGNIEIPEDKLLLVKPFEINEENFAQYTGTNY